jgi:hypothetical protein
MCRLRHNPRYSRPVDFGPSPLRLDGLNAFTALTVYPGGGAFRQATKLYVPSFTAATLSAANPWNLNCHSTPDFLRPEHSIAHSEGVRAASRRAPFLPTFENAGVQGANA